MPLTNTFSHHAILRHYCKLNDLGNACQVFDQMRLRTSISWNQSISLLSRNGHKEMALERYHSMRLNGFGPTSFTLASVLSACGGIGNLERGKECHGTTIKLGLSSNVYVGNALLSMYMKCRPIHDAIAVFKNLPKHNVVSFTTMMEGLMEVGHIDEAFDVFRLMHEDRIIDPVSISSVLGVCSKSVADELLTGQKCLGTQIHAFLVKFGFEQDQHASNTLLDMYAKNGCIDCAEALFNTMPKNVVSWNLMIGGYGTQNQIEKAIDSVKRMRVCGFEPNEVSFVILLSNCFKSGHVEKAVEIFNNMPSPSLAAWNSMLSGYSQNGCYEEAVRCFREMQFKGVGLDRATLASVLGSCASSGGLDGGKQIHAVVLKTEFYTDSHAASGLICIYAKCGELSMAKRVFTRTRRPDVVCWNAMLMGLTLHASKVEAFSFFKQMLSRAIVPTEFSYATLLSGCSSPLPSLFYGRQVHGSIAKAGHEQDVYVGTALVDIYCKCGQVTEARKIFYAMPHKGTATWNEMIHGYARNGWGHEAVNLFEKMLENRNKPDSITFIAVLTACSHSGLVDAGLKFFNLMQYEFGLEPIIEHYTCVVDCLGRAGRFRDIEDIIEQMPCTCKGDGMIWEVVLSACRVHGCVELARRAADELFRLDPSDSTPYTLLANMYSSLGRWDDVNDVRGVMGEWRVSKEPGYSCV